MWSRGSHLHSVAVDGASLCAQWMSHWFVQALGENMEILQRVVHTVLMEQRKLLTDQQLLQLLKILYSHRIYNAMR